ncbi:1-phosphofructokinase family hexose kinase [Tessaracoccus sp. Z1128]
MVDNVARRVVTFTANPSIDRTLTLDRPLERGQVLRASGVTEQAAGKGVNVARVVSSAGLPVTVVAAALDRGFRALAERAERPLTVLGQMLDDGRRVRMNTTVTEPDGTTTKLNEPGPALTDAQLEVAADMLVDVAQGAAWVTLAGSLPPGVPDDWYARLVGRLAGLGCRIAVDTSGPALDALLAAPSVNLDLIKPNAEELAQLTGGDPAALEDAADRGDVSGVVAAARRLHERGIRAVLVTLGGAGAVLVTGEGAWFAQAPRIDVRSTVGAGDSAVAGYILAEVAGADPAHRLASSVAYGSAAAELPGTTLPTPADVTAHQIDVVALS